MVRGYKIDFTRKNYSRGRMHLRDFIAEGIIAPKCKACGISMDRPRDKRGQPISMKRWLSRKTCDKKCNLIYRKNPLYFSKMIKDVYRGLKEKLKCVDCGNQLCFYSKKQEARRNWKCRSCYFKWKKSEDGHKALSKYTHCTVEGCNRVHDSKGMCSKHYQFSKSTNHKIGRPRK